MSFLNGIFSKTPAVPVSTTPPATPGAPAAGGGAGPASAQPSGPANPAANPGNMSGAPAPAPAGGPENPLDSFADIFKAPEPKPNEQRVPTLADPLLAPLDPAKLREHVNKANFTQNLNPETVQKALSGDASAFMDALNAVARESFAAAAQLSHNVAETGARTAAARLDGTLDSRFRDLQIRGQNTANEKLTHPAVAPMVNATKALIAQNNPNLSPAEVQQRAEQYFTQMAQVLAAPNQPEPPAPKAGVDDFSYLLKD